MPHIVSLIKDIKTFKSIMNLLNAGKIGDYLGDVELSAAKESLRKANIAKNGINQLWSAINHLETAFEAYLKAMKSFKAIEKISIMRYNAFCKIESKAKFSLCLMAVLYSELGENELAKEQLLKARNPIKADKIQEWLDNLDISEGAKLAGIYALMLPVAAIEAIPMAIGALFFGFSSSDPYEVKVENIEEIEQLISSR